jgi:hypothetical protein
MELRHFIRRAAFVSLSLMAFAVLTSYGMEEFYRQRDISFRLFQAIKDDSTRPELVILGDSRSALDIVSSKLSTAVFNWSEVGEGMRQTLLKVRFLLQQKDSVKWIVLPIDDYVLSEYRAENHNYRQQLDYAPPEVVRRLFITSETRIWRNLVAHYLPILDRESRLIARSAFVMPMEQLLGSPITPPFTALSECLDLGFVNEVAWSATPAADRQERVKRRLEAQFPEHIVVPEMVYILREILEVATEKGVRVIGVRHPISREYAEALASRDLTPVRAVFAELPLGAQLD